LKFTHEARELYRSAALPSEPPASKAPGERGAEAIAAADRALRMAKMLADGGFPEEAPALLAKSLHAMTAALIVARGEVPAGAPNPANIRRLVDCGALPLEALALLDATQSVSSAATMDDVVPLLSSTTRILTAIGRNEPSLTARRASSA